MLEFGTPQCLCRIPQSVDTRLSLALPAVDNLSVSPAPKTHKKSSVNCPPTGARPFPLSAVAGGGQACQLTPGPTRRRQCLRSDHLRPFDCYNDRWLLVPLLSLTPSSIVSTPRVSQVISHSYKDKTGCCNKNCTVSICTVYFALFLHGVFTVVILTRI